MSHVIVISKTRKDCGNGEKVEGHGHVSKLSRTVVEKLQTFHRFSKAWEPHISWLLQDFSTIKYLMTRNEILFSESSLVFSWLQKLMNNEILFMKKTWISTEKFHF